LLFDYERIKISPPRRIVLEMPEPEETENTPRTDRTLIPPRTPRIPVDGEQEYKNYLKAKKTTRDSMYLS
jgi:hypothetical protein